MNGAKDPYKYFRVEARDLLEQIGKGVMELERGRSPTEIVPRLLRLAHTLKGAARVVKEPEIADLAHEMEGQLAPFRDGGEPALRGELDGVLALADAVGTRLAALAPAPDTTTQPPADEPFRTIRTDVAEMDSLLDGIAETQSRLGSLRRTTKSLGQVRRLANRVAEQMSAGRARPYPHTGSGGPAENPAEDLQTLATTVERGLNSDIERTERELLQVRGAGERLRLLPLSRLFGPLDRAVRDAARAMGKRAAFRGEGGEIRLDGQVLGALQAAFVQAVRNAVAHGIEDERERVAAGKPAEGSVVVEVARRGARVAISCRDDGRGVDLSAVRRALVRRGVSTAEASGLAAEDLLKKLLEGGISTSSAVTEVSGRGIGLDVVREVNSRLGGLATMRTRPGAGTTLELVVPVSLSSQEALVVEASGATAAVPLEAVRRTIRLMPNDVASLPAGESILYEGSLVPFLPLASAFGREPRGGSGRRAWSALVLASNDGVAAVGVDRLVGLETLLVRPLPPLAPVDPIVGAGFLDAEGNPQPVLDPEHLIALARDAARARPSSVATLAPVLVVDDSLTTRMLEQSILESAGYPVEVVSSGEEALEKARRMRFSLFLVDVEMPGMDGFTLLEHFQSDPELRGIPALLVTSRSAPEDRRRGIEAGARGYIVKSEFDQAELLDRIRSLVG